MQGKCQNGGTELTKTKKMVSSDIKWPETANSFSILVENSDFLEHDGSL